jgi:hypothetical protein
MDRVEGRAEEGSLHRLPAPGGADVMSCEYRDIALSAGTGALTRIMQCAVKGAVSQWVRFPPGNYRSSR